MMGSIPVRTGRLRVILRKAVLVRRATAAVVIFSAALSVGWALEKAAAPSGLQGILPTAAPEGLGSEAFNALTGNWQAWGKATSEMVNKLYTDTKLDAAGQRELLTKLKGRVATIDKALANPQYTSLFDPLLSIRGDLGRRVDMALAMLDTLELNPEKVKAARIKAAIPEALAALSSLESDLKSVPGGDAWIPYVRAANLRKALDAGQTDGLVASIEEKLSGNNAKSDEQRKFLTRPSFAALRKALGEVRQAENGKIGSGDATALRSKLTDLENAIEAYEEDGTSADARKVRDALTAAGSPALDNGETLERAARLHYMNFNLQLVASEALVNRLMFDQRVTNGPVQDYVMNANVQGNETTTSTVSIKLEPSEGSAQIDLVLNGVTQSSTAGYTSQATIYTQGYHRFGAVKPLQFNGNVITTLPAHMTYVQPSNTTTGAQVNGVFPLFRGMANGIAMREAENRRGESEAIAAQRISSRVLPEFDAKADQQIRELDQRLQNGLKQRLKKAGVEPTIVQARTNQSFLRLSAELIGPGELAGDVTGPAGDTAAGLVVHVHETLINHALPNIGLAGKTMNDTQVRAALEKYLSQLANKPVKFPAGKGGANDNGVLIFDKDDPILVQFDAGYVNLILRAGFRQEGKEEVPTQVVTVPLKMKVVGKQVLMERGTVEVAAANESQDRAKQIARAGVMRKKLEDVIQPAPQDRVIHVPRDGRPDMDLVISNIRAESGWLTIWAD
jgi:hypothetical protein